MDAIIENKDGNERAKTGDGEHCCGQKMSYHMRIHIEAMTAHPVALTDVQRPLHLLQLDRKTCSSRSSKGDVNPSATRHSSANNVKLWISRYHAWCIASHSAQSTITAGYSTR